MDCWPLYILILLWASWHFGPLFQCSTMTCDVEVVKYWGGGLQVFSKPLSKCFWRLSYIFFITFHPITPVSVYDAILFGYVVFVFGCHQEVFDGPAPFEVYLNAIFLTYICYTINSIFYMAIPSATMATTSAIPQCGLPSTTLALTSAYHPIKWL